ncbi:MAG TPA: glycosyltransferase [Bacteroidetes bacterium]|nr:glycosyltransferase [Bacteroidota bacterium]
MLLQRCRRFSYLYGKRKNPYRLQDVVYISVTSDVATDQRVLRTARTLDLSGRPVHIIGRLLPDSLPVNDLPFRVTRFRLVFRRGFAFYACFTVRLFFFLLFRKKAFLVANDLDTLFPNFLVSRIRKWPLVYDSHEYFTGVPALCHRRGVRWFWKQIEKLTVPRIPVRITVNRSISELYRQEYGVAFHVIRNMPPLWRPDKKQTRTGLGLPGEAPILVLQGTGINRDRGAEELVHSMAYLPDVYLLIIGGGEVLPLLKQICSEKGIGGRVLFTGKMPYVQMMQYTSVSDLGLSLDKDTGLNQRYSLPNKLFDYIQAGIPVLASPLPEVRNIVETYGIGELLRSFDPEQMADQIRSMLRNREKREQWKKSLLKAASTLCWEKERNELIRVFRQAGISFPPV